jgi:hypothetical protein
VSRLVRLYPPAWRDRYCAELEDLLADRPPTARDRLDLVRGALDAWIHPQLVEREPRAEGAGNAGRRIAAGGAIVGGGLWIAGGLAMNAAPILRGLGYKDSTTALTILAAGALVTALAAVALAIATNRGSRATAAAATAMLIGAALIVGPWPVFAIGLLGYALATIPFGLLLGRTGNQPFAGLLPISTVILLFMNSEDGRALLTIPFGLAWIALGAFAFRRSPAATSPTSQPA